MVLQNHARTLTRIAALLFFLLAAAGPVRAQAGISLTARVGLNGYCKEEAWIPVRVLVENTGADVNGRVQISYRNSEGGTSIYGQDVSLPTTSRKEFFLYFHPHGFVRSLTVSLVADGKKLAGNDLNLSCLDRDSRLFGVLADDPSTYDGLANIQPLDGFVRVAPLQLADLPDRVQGWGALDALIVSGVDTGPLSEDQRTALKMWIANGGRLMVVGGPDWEAASAGLKDLLPLKLNSVRTVENLSALPAYFKDDSPLEEPVILAVGRVDKDARVLIEQDGIPLIVEKGIGFGGVVFLSADPSLKPLSGWDAMTDVYTSLLGVRPARLDWVDGSWDSYNANTAVSSVGNSGVPSSLYVCGWLILYVLAVGPVNFLLIRRTKRRELAWITIPAVVIVFSAVAYFYGFLYRGQKPILNSIAVVQAWDDSETAEVRALVGVYSPNRARYSLETTDGFMLYPFQSDSGGLQGGSDWLALAEGGGMVMPDVRVEIGGLKTVAAHGNIPALALDHDLVVTVSEQAPVLKGTITNASAFTLKDAILFTSGDMKHLGDFTPGESVNAGVSLTTYPEGPKFYALDSWNLINPMEFNRPGDADLSRRRAMLDMLLNSTTYYYNANDGNWGIYLMGWIEEPVVPVGVRDRSFDTIDTTLYVVRLTPSFEYTGNVWRLTPSLLAWESSQRGASPYYSYEIPAGGYELRFHPVITAPFDSVEMMILDVDVRSALGPQDIAASFWDFETGQWVKVENLQWGENQIPEPLRYLGPGGEVRLRIQTSTNDYVEIARTAVTMLVKP